MTPKTLAVRHRVPIVDGASSSGILFSQWIPELAEHALVRKCGDVSTRLWLDRSCVVSMTPVDDDLIKSWKNISVARVWVEVTVRTVSEELLQFVHCERDAARGIHHGTAPSDVGYDDLASRYQALGREVLGAAVGTVNRLIAFCRNVKRQYWLAEIRSDMNRLYHHSVEYQARARVDEGEWFRWCPSCADTVTVYLDGEEAPVRQEEWEAARTFVEGESRPALSRELLANAWALATAENWRSAVIESIAALEAALNEFGRASRLRNDGDVRNPRMDVRSLRRQIEHLGVRGTTRYLLPLVFDDSILPTSTLREVWRAIEIRHSLVHGKMRDVQEVRGRAALLAVERLCDVLGARTRSGARAEGPTGEPRAE